MTCGLDLAMADMRAESLDDVSLEEIVNYKLRITNCIR
jgi:hypothetical protein